MIAMRDRVAAFFSPCLTLRAVLSPLGHSKYYTVDHPDQFKLLEQMKREARIKHGSLKEDQLDAIGIALGKHGYSLETIEPQETHGEEKD